MKTNSTIARLDNYKEIKACEVHKSFNAKWVYCPNCKTYTYCSVNTGGFICKECFKSFNEDKKTSKTV